MRTILTLCVVAVTGTAAIGDCSTSQPPPGKVVVQPSFYPLKEGNKWHYRLDANGKSVKVTMSVAKKESCDGVDLFLLEMSTEGKVIATEHIASKKGCVFRHRFNGQALEKPVCIFKAPFKAGEVWQETMQIGDEAVSLSATAGEEEEVKVPAGTFKACPVRLELEDDNGGYMDTTYWFVANVGVVRQVVDLPDLHITMELEKLELVR